MQIEQDVKLDFDDVLIKPKRSTIGSRADVQLNRTFKTLNSKIEIKGIPIIAANLDTTGTFAMCESLANFGMFTSLHKFYPQHKLIDFFKCNPASQYAFYTLGITDKDIEKLKLVSDNVKIDKICIDAASGYSKYFIDKVRQIREMFPLAIIVAGNVATPEMVQEILINGKADFCKVGIGGGKFCQTRKVTGVGYPQLSAVIETADCAHGLGGHIIADGGCSTSGDICKCFGAGADFIMLGNYFSGHEECEGEWEEDFNWIKDKNGIPTTDAKKVKKALKVYGMSSKEAMDKHYGGMADYRASEGICSMVPYKGYVKDTILQILGGIRSFCSYIGTDNIKNASKCTTFIIKK